jgi:hypothetical protein
MFAAGCGLIAVGAVERERGPAFIGVGALILFVVLAGTTARGGPSLIGWPLFLALVAGAFLVIALRPARPLPPEPSGPAAATVPLDPRDPG